MEKLALFGATGFVGGNFARIYPDKSVIVPREADKIEGVNDALYLISTTHNYHVFDNLHQDIDTNLKKLMNVLPNIKGTFNFVSSWFVYGEGYSQNNPATEASQCDPRGFYSITKKTAEDLLVSYCKTFERNYRILRLCNVIGGDAGSGKKKNALEFMIRNLVIGEPINVYIGDNYRNFLHVEDVCNALNIITESGKMNEIYNVGSDNSHKIEDIVDYVVKRTNSKSKISHIDAPKFHKIVQAENFFMDCSKLKQLGFIPKYSLFEAIDTIIEKARN